MQVKTPPSFSPTARLLLHAFRAFEDDLAGILVANGFRDVTTGHFNIIRHLNPDGMRLSELARDAQISKQAIGKMIKDLEDRGYVELRPDISDGRAKHVRFSKKGAKLIAVAVAAVTEMEQHYETMLGKNNYNNLRRSVSRICAWHRDKKDN